MTTNPPNRTDRPLKSPRSSSGSARRNFILLVVGALLVASIATGSPSTSSPTASTPTTTSAPAGMFAGVDLAQLVIPGMRLYERDDRPYDDGAVLLGFVDATGTVRVELRIAVAPDATGARAFVDTALRGVSIVVDKAVDPAVGEVAWADDGGRGEALVVAASSNVGYMVNIVGDGPVVPRASNIAAQVRALMVPGLPVFPRATVTLPSVVDADTGAGFRVSVPKGQSFKLRANGAYIAGDASGPTVRPFGPGPITVIAVIADDLARVSTIEATSVAR